MFRLLIASLVLLFAVTGFAQTDPPQPPTEPAPKTEKPRLKRPELKPTVVDEARKEPVLTAFVTNADKAGLPRLLANEDVYTVFAPRNSAYDSCSRDDSVRLASPRTAAMAARHLVVPGMRLTTAELLKMDGQQLPTKEGGSITVHVQDGQVLIDQAALTGIELSKDGGVLHVIDKLLVPALPLAPTNRALGNTPDQKKLQTTEPVKAK